MAQKIEEKANEMIQEGYELVTMSITGTAKTQSDTVPGNYRGEILMDLEIKEYTSVPGSLPTIPGLPSTIGGKK